MKISTKGLQIMGTAKGKLIAAFLLIGSAFHVIAQDAPLLEKFSIDELNGKVLLNWTIAAGGTCNGIAIQRSTDSLSFEEIGSLEGVCGNLSFPTDYAYTDEAPELNARNYYRLDLGGNGFSQVLAVLVIDLSREDYALFPIPLTDVTQLHFRNDGLRKATVYLYDRSGLLVNVRADETELFTFSRSEFLGSGVYHFAIEVEGAQERISGDLYVY